jgi:CubicO group peptidase (beta-lactamase class C family)
VAGIEQVDRWPPRTVAVCVANRRGESQLHLGEVVLRWASVSKLLCAYCCLIAAEEGVVGLDEPAGPEGSTLRHLLAHASGLPFEGDTPIARPGTRRIYSNSGFELAAEHLARAAELPYEEYLRSAVLEPLRMRAELRGSPAHAVWGTAADLLAFARELLAPSLVAPETLSEATSVQLPGLDGVLPDFGRMTPNDWGLGFELKDAKSPHWTGSRNSPRTFGHFGGSGSFLWVDPDAGVACGTLADLDFDHWKDDAKRLWPAFSDDVLADWA